MIELNNTTLKANHTEREVHVMAYCSDTYFIELHENYYWKNTFAFEMIKVKDYFDNFDNRFKSKLVAHDMEEAIKQAEKLANDVVKFHILDKKED